MTNKLKYFIGNWKMFGDLNSFKIVNNINHFNVTLKKLKRNIKIVLCPPNTLIHAFNKKLKHKTISLGAQNCHHQEKHGAYTGSVSARMLKKIGAEYIILGHSENRFEGETNKIIKQKIKSTLNQNLNVIFCIGEKLNEKKSKKTFSIIKKQMKDSLDKKFNINKIILAYEPVWSIGTNILPRKSDLKITIKYIKKEYMKIFKSKKTPKVLYGGSVNPKNIDLFKSLEEIDGFLIGGASQSSKKFIDIINNYYK